jgi:lipopolysaccharide/colanic/teichoic acid biosynthesis glycosyltransferase
MPRYVDFIMSLIGLVVLSPLLAVVALLVRVSGPGPILFRQERLGWHGRPFHLIKFRSMVDHSDGQGPLVTAGGDVRVTPVGRVLRRTKLDELPQLWNVVCGDMSLVGPRPEVPRYAGQYPELFTIVLRQRPGITDICTLQLRNEEEILARAADPEQYYVQRLLPRKLAASIREGLRRNFWRDLRILVATVVPPLEFVAPLPDFRPMADLRTLPLTTATQLETMVAAEGDVRGRARVGA